jgi:subtilisin family serine protease
MSSGLLAFVLTGSALSAGAGTASASEVAADGPSASGPGPAQITLITGDRLVVSADGAVTASTVRRGIQFTVFRHDGHVFVIPSDAAPLVAAGRLDQQLFDVTALGQAGYDDRRADLPLVVKTAKRAATRARDAITKGGGAVVREMTRVGFAAVRARHDRSIAFWNGITTGSGMNRRLRPEIAGVWLDGPYRVSLDDTVSHVGAPAAWAAGYDGAGTTVAVLDTGIDVTHPDLAGKVVAEHNFTIEPDARDMFGHGTHVASIVAGSGSASGGQYQGVAPGASLLNGKVCVAAGGGTCMMSWILAGMDWAATQGADVINMSLGGRDTEGVDPLEEAVNALTAASDGPLFVASSGNTRGNAIEYSVGSPGTADAAVSVGAVDDGDNLAAFSNRGPRVGDAALKPDLTAPGVAVTAARSSTGTLGEPDTSYLAMSGTSMAAPHVAGAAAILVQRRPDWTPSQLKAALIGSAVPNGQIPAFFQGSGRVDVGQAYRQTVLVDPPNVGLGRQPWPHEDDPELARTVTYTNTSPTEAVELALTMTTLGPDGAPAPEGMFALNASSLTVPPGGSAGVTLTAATSVPAPVGLYGGHITATGPDGVRVSTAFAVDLAEESYEVTVTNIDRNGEHTTDYMTYMFPCTPGNPMYMWGGLGGPVTRFIKKGTYLVQTSMYDQGDSGARRSVMTNPALAVTEDRSITFDAGTAAKVDVGVSDDTLEQPFGIEVGSQLVRDGYTCAAGAYEEGTPVYIGQSNQAQWEPGYLAKVHAVLVRLGPGSRNPPRSYHLASFFGQMPRGWTQNFVTGALARVNVAIGRTLPGATAGKGAHVYPGSGAFAISMQGVPTFDPPFTHTEYYTAGSNLRWWPVLNDVVPSGQIAVMLEGGLNAYTTGTTVSQSWNRPVAGPAHGMIADLGRFVVRRGDTIAADVKLFGDGTGHPGHPFLLTSGQLELRRNGVVVGTSTYPSFPGFDVQGGYATYELAVTAERGAPADLSTRVSAVWTFRSDTTGGGSWVRLPIWNVSLLPTLNAANTAKAGTTFTMPATIAVQPNSTAAALATVTVQYSTNDGQTWTNAQVTGSGQSRTITVNHPNITGFVSLRATATDQAGNSVVQTIIRAYKIAP